MPARDINKDLAAIDKSVELLAARIGVTHPLLEGYIADAVHILLDAQDKIEEALTR
jgi:hypothetical protein